MKQTLFAALENGNIDIIKQIVTSGELNINCKDV